METTDATIKATAGTANAGSYLRKLCQHWSHRFPVEFDATHGTIQLPTAFCTLDATDDALLVRLDMQQGADEARLRSVVEEHLQRFGFKEELVFAWTPAQD